MLLLLLLLLVRVVGVVVAAFGFDVGEADAAVEAGYFFALGGRERREVLLVVVGVRPY